MDLWNFWRSGSENASQAFPTQPPLIFGLPDDIALLCLARVPRKDHGLLRCVSKRWRDLVCSEEWYAYRQKHSLHETWIFALCRDRFEQARCYVLDTGSSRRGWQQIDGLPLHCMKRTGMGFEVSGKKLYFLGGCGWFEDATDEVYCYDVSTNAWSESAPLPTARCHFACETLDRKIYALGGWGLKRSDPHSWDTYDQCANTWKSHMDPNLIPNIEDSMVLDGKIYIRCGTSSVTGHVYVIVYDPSRGTWEHADPDLVSGWQGPATVVDGSLYVLDQRLGTRLMMWEKGSREWVAVGRLSPWLMRPPCRLVAVGKKIYMIGKGLSTVVIDVRSAGCMDGVVLTSSSIPKLASDFDVISCKSHAI